VCRVRPPSDSGLRVADRAVYVGSHAFSFSAVMPPDAAQTEVFDAAARGAVDAAVAGCRACVMAYGQTGAGKTFTVSRCVIV
jgi:hypothetical protein